MPARPPRTAAASLLPWLLLLAPPASAGVSITSPAEGALLLGPAVQVEVALAPPLAAGEVLEARLFAGVDGLTAADLEVRDLSADLQLAPGAASASLLVADLPQGRSSVSVRRRPAAGSPPSAAASRVLDRGGFFGADPDVLGAGVLLDQLVRPSTLAPAVPRSLDLVVWYPTDDPGLPANPPYGAALGAPLAAGAASLPAVIFSHGNCGVAFQSTFLTTALARAGHVVVAISHTGNTAFDPGCNDVANQAASFFERPDDVVATIDWLLARNADVASPLHGRVDPLRIGMTGHSFGGQTTVRAAGIDARIGAALPLAPEFAFSRSFIEPLLPLAVATLVQGASLDTTTPFVPHQLALYELLVAPRFLVEILGQGHLAFSDLADAATHALVNRYALGFLGSYLAGDRRWAALLAGAPGAALSEDRPPLPQPGVCADGLDNDGDGSLDFPDDGGCAGPADASERPFRALSGERLDVRDRAGDPRRRRLSAISRDPAIGAPAAGGPDDPRSAGAELRLVNPATGEQARLDLPAAGWSVLGSGSSFKGYGFRDPGGGPCGRLLLRPGRLLRASCRGEAVGFSLDEASQGALALALRLGGEEPQCALFGGEITADRGTALDGRGRFSAAGAPPPAACPVP